MENFRNNKITLGTVDEKKWLIRVLDGVIYKKNQWTKITEAEKRKKIAKLR